MKLSIELFLAIWGAVVATLVAIFEIVKEYRQRPKVKVVARMLFRSCSENEDTHGVKVKVQRGHDILTEEALVSMTARNFGLQPIQICAVYVETENNITQVIPPELPAILQPKTSVTVSVQPEWFAPIVLDEQSDEPSTLKSEKVVSIGLYDALGKKHPLNKESFKKLTTDCRGLPLRVGIFKHKQTGGLVTAFQAKEQSIIVKK